jgi:type III secretion protein V
MNDGLFYELGLIFRPPTITVDDSLPAPFFRCEWNDLRQPAQEGLGESSVLANDTVRGLERLNIKGQKAVNPANGTECAIIDKSQQAIAHGEGLTTWDSRGYAVLALSAAIRRAAAALVNRSLYRLYVFRLRKSSPDLISTLESTIEPDFVVQVVRGLLAEEISVRDLSGVLQAVLELRSIADVDAGKYIVFPPPTGGVFLDNRSRRTADLVPADYVEFVRWSLKRYISHKYARGSNTLIVYLMDPEVEDVLASPDKLDVETAAAILEAVREEVKAFRWSSDPVLLTTSGVRRRLRRLVSIEFPHLWVVSYQELSPYMNIQPVARITPKHGSNAASR